MSKLKKNISLQIIYQFIITITPLITAPYLSRKLGAESLGIYSYTYSIVNYFVLIAMLGFTNYGTRTIASIYEDKEKINVFCQIYILQITFCIISLLIYLLIVLFMRNYTIYFFIQGLWIVSCFFDISWYFFGKEDFKPVIIKNLIIKIMSIVLILVFVKNQNDLWIYILIMALSAFFSQLFLWVKVLPKIEFKNISFYLIFRHLKPSVILFIPVLTMSIYHILDKTMLGFLSTSLESGYYYNADKIVNIPLGILTGIGTVMIPNITSLLNNGQENEVKIKIKESLEYILILAIALSCGIFAISKDFVPIFFGNGYEECIYLIEIFSVVIIFKAISDVLRTQFMIPFHKERIFIFSVIIGSITNIVANFMLIYNFRLGAFGATLGTLIAEIVVCVMQILLTKKELKIFNELIRAIPILIIGLFMIFFVRLISIVNINIYLRLVLEILFGGIFYLLFVILYLVNVKPQILKDIFNFKHNNKLN